MEKSNNFKKISVGKIGENVACEYLIKNGYKILHRNYREKWDEIDIIVKDKRQTIVFVEVKALAMVLADSLSPEDNLTSAKLKKLRRACQAFAIKNENSIDNRRGWRIDLVAVELTSPEKPKIRHYENI